MKLLIIIPAYNEALSIVNTVKDVTENAPKHDYIVINDGSTDNSIQVLKENNIKHINLPVNVGLAGVVKLGYKIAWEYGYDAALQFDGDGQHMAEYADSMLDEIKKGADIVIGSRFKKKKKGFHPRMIGSRMISLAIAITTRKKLNDPTSGMRMINRDLIKEFAFQINRPPEPDTIAHQIKNKRRVVEVQVEMRDREHGSSYLTIGRSMHYMLVQLGSIVLIQPFRKKNKKKGVV